MLELRVISQRLRRVHRGDRCIGIIAKGDPLGGGFCFEDVAQFSLKFTIPSRVVGIFGARPFFKEIGSIDALAEIFPERLLGCHEEDVARIACFVELVAYAFFHSRRPDSTPLVVVGLVARDDILGPLVSHIGFAAVPIHVCCCVALRYFKIGALTGLAGTNDAGENSKGTEEGTCVDTHRGMGRKVAELLLVILRLDQTAPYIISHAVTGHVLVGAGHPVTRDITEDDLWIHGLQVFEAEPASPQSPRSHRFDDDIGFGDQILEDLHGFGVLEVQGDTSLPTIHVKVHQGSAFDNGPRHLADIVSGRRFDLDDIGTKVHEMRGNSGGSEHRALDDSHAGERGSCMAHVSFPSDRARGTQFKIQPPDCSMVSGAVRCGYARQSLDIFHVGRTPSPNVAYQANRTWQAFSKGLAVRVGGWGIMLRIGLVGSGFLARIRVSCYAQVPGGKGRVVAIASRDASRAAAFAAEANIATVFPDFDAMLASSDIDIVDLCVPNHLHRPMTEAAAAAGKHIICTKPLAAYTGQDLNADSMDVGRQSRATMLAVATEDARAMVEAARQAEVRLCYGENWIYAPALQRAAALAKTSGGRLLEMRGWESHSGSHSPYAKQWRHTGGGALLRLGAHPIGAMLRLKYDEGLALDGEPVVPISVSAEVADLTRVQGLTPEQTRIATGWEDVENWGCCMIEFSDGSRGVAYGSDNCLGGMQSRLELSGSNFHTAVQMSPNDLLRSYAPDSDVYGDAYIMEKTDTAVGWSTPMPDEMWTSGQASMLDAFLEDIAAGRDSLADGLLGLSVTRVVYAAYLAAESGQRVSLPR
jgi:predicted dehydrogenase